jgi:hypothetical protein
VDEAAMDTKIFLESVLGSNGHYCVFGSRKSDDKKVQKFYDSIDAVISAASNLDAEGYDTYFALGTFQEANTRKAYNVLELKSFFLDLDCGEGKDYAAKPDALASLRTFCKQAKLPRPTIIDSGRGIHAYWPLTEAISRQDWEPVAEHLKQLCVEYSFVADPAVTADAARVLRIPGTHNYKDESPHAVGIIGEAANTVLFSEFKDLLGENTFAPTHKSFIPSDMNAVMQALSGSYVSKFRTIMIKTAEGKGCAQLAEVYSNQANVSEPLWRAGLSVAAFCEDRAKAIHKISNKHPAYNFDDTEEKASRIKGPYLCERFNEYNTGVCTGCQHWNKIKSPISLGREVEEASEEDNIVLSKPADITVEEPQQYIIPKYPAPYFRGKGGGVFKRVKGEDGEPVEVPVYHNDLYMISAVDDSDVGISAVLRLHLPHVGVKDFTVPLSAMTSKEELRKYMAFNGVAIIKVDEIMTYLTQWFNELQAKTAASEARKQFGWTDKNMTSFVLGNMEIYGDRVEGNPPSNVTAGLFPMFKPSGTFEGWKETLNFYNRPGFEVHQYVVGLGFGSILMELFPINGAIFHVHSKDSGLGKTTAMFAGASIWGNPDMLVLQERDTYNSKMNRAEVYKNLPLYSDEMTNTLPKDLSDFAYQIPSGQQRNRMGAKGNVERTRGEPWKLIAATTGNTSMLERIALYKSLPKAEAQRILEYRTKAIYFASKEETDIFSEQLKTHFGHAAVPFVQYVINNLPAIKELAKATQIRIDTAAGLAQENRFWSVLSTAGVLGLMIAKKAGLLNYDTGPVANWLVDLMKHNKENVTEMGGDVESILTDYLAENYNNILRIKSTDDARKGATGLDHLITPDALPRLGLVARYEYDIKRLYLMPKPLKEWCGKQQINYSGFIDGLKSGRTKAKGDKQRMGKGTNMNLPPVPVIVIDCSEFMNEETEQVIAAGAALLEKQAVA